MTFLATSFRARLAATLAVSTLGVGLVAVACTTETTAKTRLCTPNAYVYCRCQDLSEGTKQCANDGQSFAACVCGNSGGLGDNTSFQQVDAGGVGDGGLVLNGACAGKLAVLAGPEVPDDAPIANKAIFAAAYTGNGSWSVSKSTGPSLHSAPRGGLVGSSLVAVWEAPYQLLAWTKFEANQTTLAAPTSVGNALSDDPPDFVGGATQGIVVYKALSADAFSFGTYAAASGWDDATWPVSPTGADLASKSPPMAAAVGAGYAIGFGAASKLAVDLGSATVGPDGAKWVGDASVPISGAQPYGTQAPAIAALTGPEDLMLAYQGADLKLHSVTRTKANGAWNAPVLVDTSASPNGAPRLAPLAEGRAMMTWRGSDNAPYFSIYTPGSPGSWSNPATVDPARPTLRSIPSVAPGMCGSDATVTYVDDANGNVWLMLYKDGGWLGPYQVPGMTGVTYAASGEVP